MRLSRIPSALLCGSAVLLGMIGASATAQAAPAVSSSGAALSGGSLGEFSLVVNEAVQRKAAEDPGNAVLTITYDDSLAPAFEDNIARSADVWNAAVNTVVITEVTADADLAFIQYDSTTDTDSIVLPAGASFGLGLDLENPDSAAVRPIAQLWGILLGLSDNPDGDCSSVMYAGAECTETQPSADEIATATDNIAANTTLIEELRANPPRPSTSTD